ncbi:hypothetical protein VTK56DRAFT_2299 [Thermocarpiscus australiensis]
MLRIPFLSGKSRYIVLVLPLFFTFAYLITRSHDYGLLDRPRRHSNKHGRPSDWWVEFFTRLESTRVAASAITIDGRARADNWKPDVDYARPELLELSEDSLAKFRQSHASFVDQLPLFARHLPYKPATTGIVTTAGAPNFGQAVTLVLMTRQAGSRLPIEIVLDSSSPWVDSVCANVMPGFNATCLYLEDMWEGMHPLVPKFQRFQWKFISIIASTFQNVLFLDADCLPVLNPDPIFAKGAEPFTSAGFITWPDFWTPSASPLFYKIAGDIDVPPLTARTTSESGVMVYDKARHADTLLLAAYYNYNGPDHYYAMLTQHGPGEGDKETFFQAALVLEALTREKGAYEPPKTWMRPGVGVKKGYWDVKMLPKAHGRTAKGKKWRGMFMQQMDPMEDYRAVMAAIEKAKQEAETETEDKKDGERSGSTPTGTTKRRAKRHTGRRRGRWWFGGARPGSKDPEFPANNILPGHQHDEEEDESISVADFLTDSSFLATVGNLTLDHDHGRFMFFHHNGVKPDFTRILDDGSAIVATDDDDRYIRMWGDPGWIIERTGRDVEKLLWRDSMRIYCLPELRQFEEVCAEMRRIYELVYE